MRKENTLSSRRFSTAKQVLRNTPNKIGTKYDIAAAGMTINCHIVTPALYSTRLHEAKDLLTKINYSVWVTMREENSYCRCVIR